MLHYKITATIFIHHYKQNVRCMGHEALVSYVCSNVLYSHLFNCGENKEAKFNDFGAIFSGIEFTQMTNIL